MSIEIDNLEQKSRAELRVRWEGELAGKAPPSLGRDILALGIAYARQERRYGGFDASAGRVDGEAVVCAEGTRTCSLR